MFRAGEAFAPPGRSAIRGIASNQPRQLGARLGTGPQRLGIMVPQPFFQLRGAAESFVFDIFQKCLECVHHCVQPNRTPDFQGRTMQNRVRPAAQRTARASDKASCCCHPAEPIGHVKAAILGMCTCGNVLLSCWPSSSSASRVEIA